jgi:hypothetical protein
MMKHLIGAVFLLVVAACDGGEERPNPHAARCEAACATRPDTGGCSTADLDACVESCIGEAFGLSGLCMQCRVDNAFWAGCDCSCIGEGCCLSCEDGEGGPSDTCAPTDTCEAADETCNGMILGSVSDECATACALPGPDASF